MQPAGTKTRLNLITHDEMNVDLILYINLKVEMDSYLHEHQFPQTTRLVLFVHQY